MTDLHPNMSLGKGTMETSSRWRAAKEDSLQLIVWWKEYVGSRKGQKTDYEKAHPVAHRVDDGTIFRWEWAASTDDYASFAPRNTERVVLSQKLTGGQPYSVEPSRFVVQVTRSGGTTITRLANLLRSRHACAAVSVTFLVCGSVTVSGGAHDCLFTVGKIADSISRRAWPAPGSR